MIRSNVEMMKCVQIVSQCSHILGIESFANMAMYFSSWWTELYFCVFLAVLTYYAYFKLIAVNYWKNRNVPHMDPIFLIGNIWKANFMVNFNVLLSEIHREWKNKRLVGLWSFTSPVLMITDLDIIKNIFIRDFNHFRDHGFEVNVEREPLAGHLFNLTGNKWRNLRVKLTPTFTSGKMKMMFPTMMQCGQELQRYLKKVAESKEEVEVKEILARYTTDVIASCAFGIETNSLKNPNSEFRYFGKKAFEPTFVLLLANTIFNISPKLFDLLKFRFIPKDVHDFFFNAVKETIEYREMENIKRNDFMDLLIQLKKKGKLDDVDGIVPAIPDGEGDALEPDMKFSLNEAAAQAFVFFFAGFETSSTALSFALYELALNSDVQYTLQQEIDRVLAKHSGELSYDAIMEMEYLDCVVQETLRKHPPIGALIRECTKDYEIPELGVKISKKTPVFISTIGIHRDPEIYPNPDRFDPMRFTQEEKAKRDHFAFLPFGEGPRICIGNRFALLQTKVGLVSILSQYNVVVSSKTPSPLHYDTFSFILAPQGGMHLKFAARG